MNPEHEELIQRELDDDLSAGERYRLLTLIANDSEAREFREDLMNLRDCFDEFGACAPGIDLRDDILTSIADETIEPGPVHELPHGLPHGLPVAKALRGRASWRPGRREMLAFAAGIVLMFAVGQARFAFIGGPAGVDRHLAAGSLLPTTTSGDWTVLHPRPVPGNDARSTLLKFRADESNGEILVSIRATGIWASPARLVFDPASWVVESLNPSGAGPSELILQPGEIRLESAQSIESGLDLRLAAVPGHRVEGAAPLHLHVDTPQGEEIVDLRIEGEARNDR